MRRVRKLVALLLSLAMVLAMSGMAMAATLTDGEVGGFDPGHVDDPQVQDKSVNIQKEIKVYNPDEAFVYGPAITYGYAITAASNTELVTVTDQTADHTSGVATVATILAGVGTPTLTGTGTNEIAWTNADVLDASSTGVANIKYLTVDFTNVVFTQPGVYRYKITETVTYDNTGVTDGSILDTRYLDVYVMRSSTYNSDNDDTTNFATDWSIYGYVCISPESVANNAGGTTNVTEATVKTNGFVTETGKTADAYYTYNFTVTKDLVGDNNMINHQFPLAVVFNGGPTGTFQLIAELDADSKSTLTTTAETKTATVNGTDISSTTILKVGSAVALADFGNAGSPKVADGNTTDGTTTGFIKYIGIPNTAIVSVTETNDVVGTTYTASVKENGSDATITSTTGTPGANDATASIDNGETATRTAATGGTAGQIANNVQIQFTNNLATISPTGLMFRYGPYVLILICGVVLLFLGVKFMRRNKEED